MSTCLVTGGAGFIGSHLVEALVARGETVRVLDNLTTGRLSNLSGIRQSIDFINGDVTDLETVRKVMTGVDRVFHQVMCLGRKSQEGNPVRLHHNVATGTLHVLQAANECQVERVVVACSAAVYERDQDGPRQETDPTAPKSLFAIAKLTAEDYCTAFHHNYGLGTVRLRYFHAFGPRQCPHDSDADLIPSLINEVQRGPKPLISGDGRDCFDFIHVSDIVQANLLAAEAPRAAGKVYNIGTGRPTSLASLLTTINRLIGTHAALLHDRLKGMAPRHLWADIIQAQTDLGFCPCTDLTRDLQPCLHAGILSSPIDSSRTRWDRPSELGPQREFKDEPESQPLPGLKRVRQIEAS